MKTHQGDSGAVPDDYCSTPRPSVNNVFQNDMDYHSISCPSVNNDSSFDQSHEDCYAFPNSSENNDTAPSRTVAVTKDKGAIQSQTTYDNLPVYATPIPRVNHNTSINQTTDYDNLNITPTVNEESEESAYVIVSNHANLKKDKVCTYVAM